MLTYILKSTLLLSFLYLPYLLVLRKETFFRFNRLMLLLIIMVSLAVPLMDVHFLAWADTPSVMKVLNGTVAIGAPEIVVEGTDYQRQAAATSGQPDFSLYHLLLLVWGIGAMVVAVVKLVKCWRLYRVIHKGVLWTDRKDEAVIYCHVGQVAPFSWFKAIVISEDDYNQHAHEILAHELGHVRCLHSFDILLVNMLEVVMWMNPLVWLMESSLHDVHEYEADDAVLRSGVNARQYQLLLIKKAVGSSSYAFANSFNHSLLKNRITMMLKEKSNPWRRTKALYVVPVAMVALSAFATPEFVMPEQKGAEPSENALTSAITLSESKVSQIEAEEQVLEQEKTEKTVVADVDEQAVEMEEVVTEPAVTETEALPDDTTNVINTPEKLPEFDGGLGELMKFLAGNIRYPKIAQDCKVQGRVIIQFVVETDGRVSDAHVLSSKLEGGEVRDVEGGDLGVVVVAYTPKEGGESYLTRDEYNTSVKAIEKEGIRVVNATSGMWKPGMDKGKQVRVRFNIPLTFRLQ